MYWKYFVMHPVTRAASTLDFETRRGRWLWYQGYHFIYGAERRHAWLQHQHVWMSAELGHWCLLIYDCWYKQQGEFWAAQATHSNSVQCCKSSTRTSWCKTAEADQDLFRVFLQEPPEIPTFNWLKTNKRPSIEQQQERVLGETFTGKKLHLMTSYSSPMAQIL